MQPTQPAPRTSQEEAQPCHEPEFQEGDFGEADLATDTSSDDEAQLRAQNVAELYDEDLDEKDAAWVHKHRQGRQSDAVLSCPGCLTTVCIDCQQHDQIPNQYRAMFVMNCRVKSKAVAAPAAPQGGKRKRSRQGQDQAGTQEQFYPVECAECGTQVAMRDKDEVYHFYQVVASSA